MQWIAVLLLGFLAACAGDDGPPPGRRVLLAVCGNGRVEADEECDDGNRVTESCPYGAASCRVCDADCRLVPGRTRHCGDGVVDPVEEDCDEPPASCPWGESCYVCGPDCRLTLVYRRCGDGVIDPDGGELCDDGEANDDRRPGACTTRCQPARCGDGIAAEGECEPPGVGLCRDDCTFRRCGDGILDPGEACDDGAENGAGPDRCRSDCRLPTCGDGIVDAGEACDAGPWAATSGSVHGDAGCLIGPGGRLHCWGLPGTPPQEPVLQVSVGDGYACAVLATGQLACWGAPPFLQPWQPSPIAPPPGVFQMVAVGRRHACALDRRSQILCWGVPIATNWPVGARAQIVSGDGFSCARRDGGPTACWGADLFGVLDVPVGSLRHLAASPTHLCGIRAADEMPVCWGDDRLGQTRAPSTPMRDLAVGPGWSCGIDTEGRASCWGDREATPPPGGDLVRFVAGSRCAFDSSGGVSCAPGASLPIPGNADVAGAACRSDCSAPRCGDGLVDPGEACDGADCPGCVRPGFCGDGVVQEAVEDCDDGNAVTESCPYATSCEVCTAACRMGPGLESRCGDGRIDPPESCDDGNAFLDLDLGASLACGLRPDGTLRCWDQGGVSVAPLAGRFEAVRVGAGAGCALDAAGELHCFGEGAPVPPPGPWRAFDVGDGYACAIAGDGTLRCFGSIAAPPAGNGWSAIAAGPSGACALHANGGAACWGEGVALPAGGYRALSVGSDHLCAIRGDGSLLCLDAEGFREAPLGSYVAVASTRGTSCALDQAGGVGCFGAAGWIEPVGRFRKLAAGPGGICGLREDGRADCFLSPALQPPGNGDSERGACDRACGVGAPP